MIDALLPCLVIFLVDAVSSPSIYIGVFVQFGHTPHNKYLGYKRRVEFPQSFRINSFKYKVDKVIFIALSTWNVKSQIHYINVTEKSTSFDVQFWVIIRLHPSYNQCEKYTEQYRMKMSLISMQK